VVIGSSASGDRPLAAEVDEVQLYISGLTAGAVGLLAETQKPEGQAVSVGEEETGEGGGWMPSFQMGATLRNMSLDGWIIVLVTMGLGAVSMAVFVNKVIFLRMAVRENGAFLESFRETENLTGLEAQADDFSDSSLFRVYSDGCAELKARLGNPHPSQDRPFTPKALNSFKAVLEKGATREVQLLDKWVVILTLAISGAPFLGLLGTVWGVMTTFSTMSATGEASIMAIAPGIASALVTTIVGLLVAIPSLFAYNYLTGKMKQANAQMYHFVDDFVCRVDEAFGGGGS